MNKYEKALNDVLFYSEHMQSKGYEAIDIL